MSLKDEIFGRMFHDEKMVPEYTLPEVLESPDETAFHWVNHRRRQVLELCREMFGPIPGRPDSLRFEQLSYRDDALNNTAIRKEVRIHCGMADGRAHYFDLLLYMPKTDKPVPVCVGLNFKGNHACTDEKDVTFSWSLMPEPVLSEESIPKLIPFTEENRGAQKERWCFEELVRRGYASATVHYFQVFPDYPGGFADSIFKLFYTPEQMAAPDREFGAVGAWAWGLMRIMDYLETEPGIDKEKTILHGHSRLGKTALWAGANDSRFRLVYSNDSGCCGAALTRRNFGETLDWLLYWRKYWFNMALNKYIGHENEMPFDQHMLIALIAPRLAYVASATEDTYADPKGEFTSAKYAAPAYGLFGSPGLGVEEWPPPETPVGCDIGYHLRVGKHDITPYDWKCVLDFADHHFV